MTTNVICATLGCASIVPGVVLHSIRQPNILVRFLQLFFTGEFLLDGHPRIFASVGLE